MKKVIKWGLIIFAGFIVLGLLFSNSKKTKGTPETKPPVEEQKGEKQKSEPEKVEELTTITPTPTAKSQSAILSGKDPETGNVILEINVWEEIGSGGPENVAIGRVPHDTRVEVLETKEVEGNTFYKIRSSEGKVSVLPTDFALRKKKMEELPESEWFVPADPSFPVEGWVSEVFITDLE